MTPLTDEWVLKAEADFQVAARELAVQNQPNYDGICFHSQQCVEKYIKACLQHQKVPVPRTHNLRSLASLLSPAISDLEQMHAELRVLSELAVSSRYPGYFADQGAAREAFSTATRARLVCRQALNLDPVK